MDQQRQALDRIEDQPPPGWFTVLGLASGAVLVGGTAWLAFAYAAQFAFPTSTQSAVEVPAVSPPEQPAQPAAALDAALPCSECGYPGTACESGQCRLAPGVSWRLSPMALVRQSAAAPPAWPLRVCARMAGNTDWTCSRASSQVLPSTAGRWVTNFAKMGPELVVTREDLETRGLDIEVRQGDLPIAEVQAHVWSTIVAGKLLFQGGLSYPTSVGNAVFRLQLAGQ